MHKAITPFSYLQKLQLFKHRGVGTFEAKKSAEYIIKEYRYLGLRTGKTSYGTFCYMWVYNSLFAFALVILSVALYFEQYFTALLTTIVFALLTILYYKGDHLLPRPKIAHDVFAEIKSTNESIGTIVVMAHYDTAPFTFGLKFVHLLNKFSIAKKLLNSFEKKPFFLRAMFLPIYIGIILLMLGFLIRFVFSQSFIYLLFYGLAGFIFVSMTVIFFMPLFSKYVPGAFDNGTGVATVISLASHFCKNKPKNTRLILLNEGSEEGCLTGFDRFFKKAKIDLSNTIFINLDSVGGDIVYIANGECDSSFGNKIYYNKNLFAKAVKVVRANKKFKIKKKLLQLATNAYPLHRLGANIMTTLTSVNENGGYEEYHQMTDTIEKVNFKTLDICRDFLIKLIKELDDPLNFN